MSHWDRALRWGSLCLVAAIMAGCNRQPPLKAPQPVEVVISQPVKEQIADWDTYTGTVTAKEAPEIRARVRGEIQKVLFTEGEEIDENAPLFVIDDQPFQAELKQAKGQLETWKAKLKNAEEQIAIYKPLAEKGTVAKKELVEAYASKGEAIGGIDTANGKIMEAEINIKYCKINSPIAGKVGQAMLTKGNIANSAGQDNLLTTVISVDPMYVYFYVTQKDLLTYQAILKKRYEKEKKQGKPEIPVEMALTVDTDFPYKGIVDFVDNKVDKSTGTYKVRARFPNPKLPTGGRSLTAGLFARVRISIAEPYQAVLIADRAILSDQSLKYVLVVNKEKNNIVERMDITQANRVQADGLRAVESGLKGDEWIIVDGVNRARPGAPVNPKDAAMPRRAIAAKTQNHE